jgi:RNA polymerase sigma-70 factor (ECF subfamily)
MDSSFSKGESKRIQDESKLLSRDPLSSLFAESGKMEEESAEADFILHDSPITAEGPDREAMIFNRFLAGSDEAFRMLYDLYERPLYVYLIRLVNSEADAQDLFQEVWLRMFRLRDERESITKFSGLLFTVARNLALNAIRHRTVLPNVPLADISEGWDLADLYQSGRLTLEIEEADMREMLQKALAQLPLEQREAFILREYNGYSYQEIAGIMHSTESNAKIRAWRARERLRKMISAWMELRKKDESEPGLH